jgi:hypothetical protein
MAHPEVTAFSVKTSQRQQMITPLKGRPLQIEHSLLGPKLCLGPHFPEALLPVRPATDREPVHSRETEFGIE